MTTLSIYYDELTPTVEAQIVRDLLLLSDEFDFKVNTKTKKVIGYLNQLGIELTDEDPDTALIYRVGEDWPKAPIKNKIKRDLFITEEETRLRPGLEPGYFLPEGGRTGRSLTEMYLNRRAPQGQGIMDPTLLMIWG